MRLILPILVLSFPIFAQAERFQNIHAGDRIAISPSETLTSMDKPNYGVNDSYFRRKVKEIATYNVSETEPDWFQKTSFPDGATGTVEKVESFHQPNRHSPATVVINIIVKVNGERLLITQRTSAWMTVMNSSERNAELFDQAIAKIEEFPNIRLVRP